MDRFVYNKKIINKNIGNFRGKIKYIDHHISHQSYCSALNYSKNQLIYHLMEGRKLFNKNYFNE